MELYIVVVPQEGNVSGFFPEISDHNQKCVGNSSMKNIQYDAFAKMLHYNHLTGILDFCSLRNAPCNVGRPSGVGGRRPRALQTGILQ